MAMQEFEPTFPESYSITAHYTKLILILILILESFIVIELSVALTSLHHVP